MKKLFTLLVMLMAFIGVKAEDFTPTISNYSTKYVPDSNAVQVNLDCDNPSLAFGFFIKGSELESNRVYTLADMKEDEYRQVGKDWTTMKDIKYKEVSYKQNTDNPDYVILDVVVTDSDDNTYTMLDTISNIVTLKLESFDQETTDDGLVVSLWANEYLRFSFLFDALELAYGDVYTLDDMIVGDTRTKGTNFYNSEDIVYDSVYYEQELDSDNNLILNLKVVATNGKTYILKNANTNFKEITDPWRYDADKPFTVTAPIALDQSYMQDDPEGNKFVYVKIESATATMDDGTTENVHCVLKLQVEYFNQGNVLAPDGVYTIGELNGPYTCQASEGVDELEGIMFSFLYTLDEFGFRKDLWCFTSGTVTLTSTEDGKHYYTIDAISAKDQPVKVQFLYDENADLDGIKEVSTSNSTSSKANAIYDLQGRRVENPGHGIYIRNGKKIMF